MQCNECSEAKKRCQDNARNFGAMSTALLKYTKVFYKCLNDCVQCNECAKAEKGTETMLEILVP